MTPKTVLIGATAIAIALTGFDLRPVAAASEGQLATAQHDGGVDELGAARKRRRGVNPAIPLAAFGAIAGTIASVAAANRRREYYEGYYHAPRYYQEPRYYNDGPRYYGGGGGGNGMYRGRDGQLHCNNRAYTVQDGVCKPYRGG